MLPIFFISRSAIFKPRDRLFPMWKDPQTGMWVGPIEYSYPPRPMILSTLLCAVVLIAIPLATFTIMQLFVWSIWDWTAASLGLLEAIALMLVMPLFEPGPHLFSFLKLPPIQRLSQVGNQHFATITDPSHRTVIQVITKQYIGAFRPYFLSACNPNTAVLNLLAPLNAVTAGNVYSSHHRVFATSGICRPVSPVLLRRAMQSWPSGHTGTAFAAAVFLALYLNAKLKAFSDYETHLWKMFAITAPLIGAILVAGGLTIDHNHHASDILTSIPLGIFSGLLAYRAKYLSLFDYRTNHIPLVHDGVGQSVLPPTLGAALPVGQYLAVRWPKTPLGGPPLNYLNLPNLQNLSGTVPSLPVGVPVGVPDLPGGPPNVPHLPAGAPSAPGLPSAADAVPDAQRFGRSGTGKAQAGDGTGEEEHNHHAMLNDYAVDVPDGFLPERRGTNETVVPTFRRRRSNGASSGEEDDGTVTVRVEEAERGERGEQMV